MSFAPELRALYPKISDMEPKAQDAYFHELYKTLERRSYGNYEGGTVDNFTFVQENICDDPVAAFKGKDAVRQIWNKNYGSLFRGLQWRFYSLSNFVKFHRRFAEKCPARPCTITLNEAFGDPATVRSDIRKLLYALDNSRNNHKQVEEELRIHFESNTGAECALMFNGVGLSVQCSWDEESRTISKLQVTGPLGVVLEGTDWDDVLNGHRVTLLPDREIEKVQSETVEENLPYYGSVETDEKSAYHMYEWQECDLIDLRDL